VRDYRSHLVTVAKRPVTINNTCAAIDDFYTRRGLGPATADRPRAAHRGSPGTRPEHRAASGAPPERLFTESLAAWARAEVT
jgi:hypothetical protein